MEAEMGMARIYGYADPGVYRDELRVSNQAGITGGGHTTGSALGRDYVGAGEDVYLGRSGRSRQWKCLVS